MADKDKVPAKAKTPDLDALIEEAEALLHPPKGGNDLAEQLFDDGVRAVVDLLRAHQD